MFRRASTMCVLAAGFLATSGSLQPVEAGQPRLTNNSVKIGVLSDMSGIFADLGGPGSVVAAQMAIDDFKAEKKPDFKIELVSADHQNKADVAANLIRGWYDVDGVDMVTDAINSAVALAASKVAAARNRVLFVTGAGTTRLSNEDCSPNTIHYGWDTYALANGPGVALTKGGRDTWYFLAVDYALGHAIERDALNAVKKAGGKVVGSIRHPIGTSDFSSYLLQAQSSGAKVVAFANAGGDLHNAVKGAREFGLTANQTIIGLASSITDVHALGLETTHGMVMVEGFYWDRDDQTRRWSERFVQKSGKSRKPNMIHAATYSSVRTYLDAVLATGTDSPEEVLPHLQKVTINDVFTRGGKIRKDNLLEHEMFLVEVKKPSESKYAWDYYKVRETLPVGAAFQPLADSRCAMVTK